MFSSAGGSGTGTSAGGDAERQKQKGHITHISNNFTTLLMKHEKLL